MTTEDIQQTSAERLSFYLNLYEQIRRQVGNEQVAASILQEIGKDRRASIIHSSRQADTGLRSNENSSQPATPKQLKFLKQLGVQVSENLTKKEASDLIDRAQAGDKEAF